MRTTDNLGMPVFRDISRTVLSVLNIENIKISGQ